MKWKDLFEASERTLCPGGGFYVLCFSTRPDLLNYRDNLMAINSSSKCWEIINCDHLDCLARSEPETPCWQIARKFGSYRDVSNTCRDCIVYLIKSEDFKFDKNEISEILSNREGGNKIGTGYRACILKTSSI